MYTLKGCIPDKEKKCSHRYMIVVLQLELDISLKKIGGTSSAGRTKIGLSLVEGNFLPEDISLFWFGFVDSTD